MTISRKALFPEKYNLMRAQDMCTIRSLWERQQNWLHLSWISAGHDLCWGLEYDLQCLWDEPEGADVIANCEQPQLLSSFPVSKLKEWYWILRIFWYVAAKASSDLVRELILF